VNLGREIDDNGVMTRRFGKLLVAVPLLAALGVALYACMEVPPKIDSIPASGLSLRVYAFGASAQDTRQMFEAVKQNNKQFSVVQDGGDGEVLIGLENDSPKCVAPTALCSYKVAYRIRDNANNVLFTTTTSASASANTCSDLCGKVLSQVVVKVVDKAASLLKGGAIATPTDDASVELADAGSLTDGPAEGAAPEKPTPGKKKPAKPEPPKPTPPMCSVGAGGHLPTHEAETRAAQVETLKRLGILDQTEYDCLRKAYLERL
jgi:hypothetical protein